MNPAVSMLVSGLSESKATWVPSRAEILAQKVRLRLTQSHASLGSRVAMKVVVPACET